MINADYHIHSNLSHDGISTMEEYIKYAIRKQIKELCFTEHFDIYDGLKSNNLKTIDVKNYFDTFQNCKKKYENKVNIKFGIEIGLQPDIKSSVKNLVETYPFDFIIGSSHITCKKDISKDSSFFEGLSKKQAYMNYFNEVLQNIKSYDEFDVYGHMDYIVRYGDYEDKYIFYKEYKEILDEMLTILIKKDKGIEVNTSGYKYGLYMPHPNIDILDRYRKLGGTIITIGSDAHETKYLCSNFEKVKDILKCLGYRYYTTFDKREPHFVKL